jgi:hypothetical protein
MQSDYRAGDIFGRYSATIIRFGDRLHISSTTDVGLVLRLARYHMSLVAQNFSKHKMI